MNDTTEDLWKKITEGIKPLKQSDRYIIPDEVNPYSMVTKKGDTTYIKLKPVHVSLQDISFDRLHPLMGGHKKPVTKLSAKEIKNLKYQASLDLHGYTQLLADKALLRFFDIAQARGSKYVLIITGKGDPVHGSIIRSFTEKWFKDHFEYVVGYAPALPKDGGEGAFYVHVRRIRF